MSSLQSTIYDHWVKQAWYMSGDLYKVECQCGQTFPDPERWAKHLSGIIAKDFIDVTPVPALPPKAELNTEAAASSMFSHSYPNEPARPKEEPPDTIKVEVSINGELHTVINVKPKRLPL